MIPGELPEGLEHQRTTDTFDSATVPAGLLRAHQIAAEVWGVIEVLNGTVTFVWENPSETRVVLGPRERLVIPPTTSHHVEPGPDARFRISFYR